MDKTLLNKLPKKWHKFVKDIYKEGARYSMVIEFEDGFSRSIGDTRFRNLKDYAREIIEENRNAEY